MQKAYWAGVIVSVLCGCSVLMAEEHGKAHERVIPEQFIGTWIEKGEQGNAPGKITVSQKRIVWLRSGVDTETVKAEDISISQDNKKLMFSSAVVVIQGTPIPADKLDGKASVVLLTDKDDLVVELTGIKEKVQRCGAVPTTGYAGITRQIVDGKMITCINYSPQVLRYRKIK